MEWIWIYELSWFPLALECSRNFTDSQEKVTENWCLSDPSFALHVYYRDKVACCVGQVPISSVVRNAEIESEYGVSGTMTP